MCRFYFKPVDFMKFIVLLTFKLMRLFIMIHFLGFTEQYFYYRAKKYFEILNFSHFTILLAPKIQNLILALIYFYIKS